MLVFLIWAIASVLAMTFAALQLDSVLIGGQYIPFGNDSFYHARRILDAVGERGFYQFDSSIHLPEGSWVAWSWGYDLALAAALKLALWLNADLDSMKFLVYVPVFWVPINIALLLGMGRQLRLPLASQAIAALALALLPLLQLLHGVGRIDHHFMELTFVLLVSWRVLCWFNTQSRGDAIACGVAAGLALLVHHALFILQLPLVVAVALLWVRRQPPAHLLAAALALLASTLLAVLPSGPFRDGQFDLGTLSVFHLYVALATASLLVFFSWRERGTVSSLLFCALLVLLATPVIGQLVLGTRFLSGSLFQANSILEVASPLAMIQGDWGLRATLSFYTGLLLLVPLVLAAYIWQLLRGTDAAGTAFAVFTVFGLGLLLMQFRLNYFGLAFMLLGPLHLFERLRAAKNWQQPGAALAAVLVFAVALQPGLAGTLLSRYHAGGDHYYEVTRPLFLDLNRLCQAQAATVVASQQLGHYIRFHSACPVIANNFLLTPQHFDKAREVALMFDESPQGFRQLIDEPVYLIAFLWGALDIRDATVRIENVDAIQSQNPRLLVELFFGEPVPAGFELIDTVSIAISEDRGFPVARLYRVQPKP